MPNLERQLEAFAVIVARFLFAEEHAEAAIGARSTPAKVASLRQESLSVALIFGWANLGRRERFLGAFRPLRDWGPFHALDTKKKEKPFRRHIGDLPVHPPSAPDTPIVGVRSNLPLWKRSEFECPFVFFSCSVSPRITTCGVSVVSRHVCLPRSEALHQISDT